MVKLKRLIQEILQEAGRLSKFWWLSPDAKLRRVSPQGHAQWAWVYLITIHGVDDKDPGLKDVYEYMGQLGWVGVGFVGYMDRYILEINYSKKHTLTRKQMEVLRNLAIEEGVDEIHDNTKGKIYTNLNEAPVFNKPLFKKHSSSKRFGTKPTTTKPSKTPVRQAHGMTYADLMKNTTPERKEKARSHIRIYPLPVSVEENNEQWNFRYRSDRETGNPGESYQGAITFLKGEIEQGDDATKLQCKVDCECKDYMYRFAWNNASKGSGDVGPDTLSGVINRKPKPAYDYGTGLCKHLAALSRYLQTKISATKKSNLFEAIDEVAKQGPFTIFYND